MPAPIVLGLVLPRSDDGQAWSLALRCRAARQHVNASRGCFHDSGRAARRTHAAGPLHNSAAIPTGRRARKCVGTPSAPSAFGAGVERVVAK